MRLKTALRPYFIIYDLVRGIGAGGFHAFLFRPISATDTDVRIMTTISVVAVAFEGLHDQMNQDVYREVQAIVAHTQESEAAVWVPGMIINSATGFLGGRLIKHCCHTYRIYSIARRPQRLTAISKALEIV
ncbi:MAG: hypothetical protein U0641_08110 [Anaerolineae bacterium]